MKVISKGIAGWQHQICRFCKSQLEIEQDDVYRSKYDALNESFHDRYFVRCVCGGDVHVHNLPKEVEQRAIKEHVFNMKPKTVTLRDAHDFPKKGIVFKDISPLLRSSVEFKQLIQYLGGYWEGRIDSIGGFDARGFIFASALAYEMGLPFFMLRKKGKLPGSCKELSYDLEYGSASLEIQSDAIERKGERVLLVDDLLATGGTALAGCKLVESLGGEVAGVQFIVELEGLPGRKVLAEAGHKVKSILLC